MLASPRTGYNRAVGIFAASHYALAGLTGFLAVVHLALAVARRERIHVWTAMAFVGWVVVTLAIARSSVAGGGEYSLAVHFALGLPSSVCLWFGALFMAWDHHRRGMTRARWAVVAGIAAVIAARTVEVPLAIQAAPGPLSWEDIHNAMALWTAGPFFVVSMGVCAAWLVAGYRAAQKQGPGIALLLAIPALVVLADLVWEVALTFELVQGPTLIGFDAVVFVFYSTSVVALGYAQAKDEDELETRYQIVRKVAEGGMGALYLAVRKGPAGFERQVAVKTILRPDDDRDQDRFLVEAKVAAQLSHPNIVSVFDLGQTKNGWFMAMEFLDGVSVAEFLRQAVHKKRPVPIHVVATVGERVCRGLSHAHQRGVIHRDISPQNIMITFTGDIKIIDFGIAKLSNQDAPAAPLQFIDTVDTQKTKGMIGKLRYMSPERWKGETATIRSDLYALMIVLFEMVAQDYPFDGDNAKARAKNLMSGALRPIKRLRPDCPEAWVTFFAQGLSPDPVRQFSSAEVLGEQLVTLREQQPPASLEALMQDLFKERLAGQAPVVDDQAAFAPTEPVEHDTVTAATLDLG